MKRTFIEVDGVKYDTTPVPRWYPMWYWLMGRSRTVRVTLRELQGVAHERGWPRACVQLVRLILAL